MQKADLHCSPAAWPSAYHLDENACAYEITIPDCNKLPFTCRQ